MKKLVIGMNKDGGLKDYWAVCKGCGFVIKIIKDYIDDSMLFDYECSNCHRGRIVLEGRVIKEKDYCKQLLKNIKKAKYPIKEYKIIKRGISMLSATSIDRAIITTIKIRHYHEPKTPPKPKLWLHTDYLGAYGLEVVCFSRNKEEALTEAKKLFKWAEKEHKIKRYSGYLDML